jgi:hypothetical protein
MRTFVIDDEFFSATRVLRFCVSVSCSILGKTSARLESGAEALASHCCGRTAFVGPAEDSQFSSPRMISIRPDAPAVKGLRVRSDERAEERAPLTAAASGQVIHLSGAKKTKKICSGQKQPRTGAYTNFSHCLFNPRPIQVTPRSSRSPMLKKHLDTADIVRDGCKIADGSMCRISGPFRNQYSGTAVLRTCDCISVPTITCVEE